MANRSGGGDTTANRPVREVDSLTTRMISAIGEEMGAHLTAGRRLTGEELLKSALTIAASSFALSDIERESLQGVLRGTTTRLIDLWRKRKDRESLSAAQAGEWATKFLLDDYAKTLDDGEKSPTLLSAMGLLSVGERKMLISYLWSLSQDDRRKVIDKGDKIIVPLRALRGALAIGEDDMRLLLLRKIIRIPEESGIQAMVKKTTGIDLSKPEKFLDAINVDGVADKLNARATESRWRMAIHERNRIDRIKRDQEFLQGLKADVSRAYKDLKRGINIKRR